MTAALAGFWAWWSGWCDECASELCPDCGGCDCLDNVCSCAEDREAARRGGPQ